MNFQTRKSIVLQERCLMKILTISSLGGGDCDVFKPDGSVLMKYRKSVIPQTLCAQSFPSFRIAASPTNNRGTAAGIYSPLEVKKEGLLGKTGLKTIKRDGTLSNTHRAVRTVNSGIVGFFDRNPRFPYCRLTAYNLNNMEEMDKILPYIRFVDGVFKSEMPERYEAQLNVVQKTNKDFYIHGTSFTTITVNKNFQTAVHKDVGDLKEGFGVMSCLRAGSYEGCFLCFPKYRVAVDLKTGDVVMADVHEFHGNTSMKGKLGHFERVSLVFYYREGMVECGSAQEEAKRAAKGRDEFYKKQLL